MPEDFGKELLMLGGTLAGFIAAMLTVMEKLIDIQHRLGTRKDRKGSVQQERQSPAESAVPVRHISPLTASCRRRRRTARSSRSQARSR